MYDDLHTDWCGWDLYADVDGVADAGRGMGRIDRGEWGRWVAKLPATYQPHVTRAFVWYAERWKWFFIYPFGWHFKFILVSYIYKFGGITHHASRGGYHADHWKKERRCCWGMALRIGHKPFSESLHTFGQISSNTPPWCAGDGSEAGKWAGSSIAERTRPSMDCGSWWRIPWFCSIGWYRIVPGSWWPSEMCVKGKGGGFGLPLFFACSTKLSSPACL